MEVYVELRGNRWIRVTGRLKQVVVSKGRKSLRYVLVGESVGELPKLDGKYALRIPASKLNKVILRLIEEGKGYIIVFEKTGVDEYTAKAESMEALSLLKNIVEDVFSSGRRTASSEPSREAEESQSS
ncbi:hypothetical protein Desmu_0908 [Desulfurococcus mucosus DSM 2162]|uniref:Uncharacterized protein n=1 Tax=Desulfurococcus mucosus (strain ATCC 35584 / DSM 2162 / JCM 9187 / O7/1) TaxID=765177 RepID=E8R9N5_DESM0|nr:hypothetical protein [Desulfurococcus mucosus]ADV65211.1 hypothetical protein Desmu_0908 [Desulfurococcus mucosus DSM 2162]